MFVGNLVLGQTCREQAEGFADLHRVDRLANRGRGKNVVDTRRDQPDAVRPALQEGPQVLLAPGIIDDHENAPIAERFAKLPSGGVDRLQPRPLAP